MVEKFLREIIILPANRFVNGQNQNDLPNKQNVNLFH